MAKKWGVVVAVSEKWRQKDWGFKVIFCYTGSLSYTKLDRWMDGCLDGWIDRQAGRQTDRQTNRQDRQIQKPGLE